MVKTTKCGQIYVVATPIGNLGDFTPRAQQTLAEADLIAAEDTRHSQRLLSHFNISTKMTAYHEHNEQEKSKELLTAVQEGKNLALISDAGTPLISDPGFRLTQQARALGVEVLAVPGACAAIAALSIAGLPSDRFLFAGFLPAKSQARQASLKSYAAESLTTIFYESSHRILACIKDMVSVIPEKQVVIARELTKTFETVLSGIPAELLKILEEDHNQQKGEFVILLAPAEKIEEGEHIEHELKNLLELLLEELPLKKAVTLAVKLTGQRKNHVYQMALGMSSSYK